MLWYEIPSDKESYLDVIYSPINRDFYEKAELNSLEEQLGSLSFFVIIFNKFEELKQFLQTFPDDVKILIDNDFGKIMRRDEVLKFETYKVRSLRIYFFIRGQNFDIRKRGRSQPLSFKRSIFISGTPGTLLNMLIIRLLICVSS